MVSLHKVCILDINHVCIIFEYELDLNSVEKYAMSEIQLRIG